MLSRKFSALFLLLLLVNVINPVVIVQSDKQDVSSNITKIYPRQKYPIDPMPFNQNASIKAYRTVRVSPYGFATYNDTIIITNKENREFNSIIVFYNKSTFKYLKEVTIIGKYKGSTFHLTWVEYIQKGDYIGMALLLNRYVEKNTKYEITILGGIYQIPTFRAMGNEILYKLLFPQKILLPYNVSLFKSNFETLDSTARIDLNYIKPSNGSLQGDRILFYTFRNEFLFNFTSPGKEPIVEFSWFSKTPIVIVSSFERTVQIEVTEKMHVRDSFRITAIAPKSNNTPKDTPWKLTSLIIGLPSDISSLTARDDLGKIRISKTTTIELLPENYTGYSVNLRIPLVSSSSYSFTLDYYIKSGTKWFKTKEDKWHISIPLTPILNTTFLSVKYSIMIPEGFEVNTTTISNLNETRYVDWSVLGVLSYSIFIGSFTHVTPMNNKEVKLSIKPTPMPLINTLIRIFLLVLFILSVLNVVYVYYRKLRERAVVAIPEVSLEIKENVEKFLKYYEEFVAIEKNLDDFIKSKLTQRKSPKAIRDQLQKLLETNKRYRDRVIAMFNLITKDPDIAKIVKELRDIENRISTTRRETISDWSQYLRGALGKRELIARADELFGNLRILKTNRNRLINRIRNIYITRYVRRA